MSSGVGSGWWCFTGDVLAMPKTAPLEERREGHQPETWPSVRSNRWLVERFHRRVIQVRFPESWSSTFSGEKTVLGTAEEIFVLDNAFALIEGQPLCDR